MRSPLSGSIATCLFFVPLVAVPLLAVLGMPQLSTNAPVAASDELKFAAEDPAAGNSDLSNPVKVSDSKAESTPSRPPRTASKSSDPFAEFSRDSDGSNPPAESADKNASPRKRPQRWSEGNGLPQKALLSIDRPGADQASANPSDRPAVLVPTDDQAVERTGREASPKSSGGRRALPEAQAVVAMASEPMAAAASGEVPAGGRTAAPAGSVNATSWKRAISRLNALGIQDYQLQPGERDGEFNFSCRFAARSNPQVIHRFEAEAADPLEAVNQVLRQLDDWRARHFDRRQAAHEPAVEEKAPARAADSSDVEVTNRAF